MTAVPRLTSHWAPFYAINTAGIRGGDEVHAMWAGGTSTTGYSPKNKNISKNPGERHLDQRGQGRTFWKGLIKSVGVG